MSNLCSNPRHGKEAFYSVQGVLTRICVFCVAERAKEMKCSNQEAADTFQPSPIDNE